MNICAALLLATAAHGQDPRYQQHAGRYGGNAGICLFEDGKFMLYGYATAVFGQYLFEKDYLLFYPDQPPLFTVYAHKNPAAPGSTRINFVNFQQENTAVQLDQAAAIRVFNEDANCFDGPFVHQQPGLVRTFSLIAESAVAWQYQNEKGYNDFVFIYNQRKREYENFSARLEVSNNGKVLKTDMGSFELARPDEDGQRQWKEAQQWKDQYFAPAAQQPEVVYANKHYNSFAPDLSKYKYDTASAQYISLDANENEAYFRQNQYNDNRYLRLYEKWEPRLQSKLDALPVAAGSIFFTVCGEGSEKSYHYNGFVKYEAADKNPLPTTTVPNIEK